METTFENFKLFSSLNSTKKRGNKIIKDSHLNSRINNYININIKFSKDYNYNFLENDNIKMRSLKKPKNIEINYKFNEDYDEININKKEKTKKIDSLLEIKNYKTELCHTWELTGFCKYGLNVR